MTVQQNKILIIEDEALVARELKSRLSQMGWDVVGIAYGREAYDLALQSKPDLILSDIHLKDGEDGIELAKRIQLEHDVPFVFLTAYSDEDTVARAKELAPYGYIIKPVENRELQIAIDMAIYKFSVEKKLRDTQQLLENALTCIGSALIFIDKDGKIADINADAEGLVGLSRDQALNKAWAEVLNLYGASIQNNIKAALDSNDVAKLAPFIITPAQGSSVLVDGLVGPMKEGGVMILRGLTQISDPIEMMPTTEELIGQIGDEHLTPSESSMCQLLISGRPDELISVEEVIRLLNQQLRVTDLVSTYGDTLLSVSMPYTSVEEGKLIAGSVLKALKEEYKTTGLVFSVGLAYSSPGDDQPFELFRRASWALKVAEDSGGGRVITWHDNDGNETRTSSEAEKEREYHNLVLLWNVLNVVARATSVEDAGARLCVHLVKSFQLESAALLEKQGDGLQALAGEIKEKSFSGISDLGLNSENFSQCARFLANENSFQILGDVYLFRLDADRLFYINTDSILSASDIDFLRTLVSYFAAGIARFVLPEEEALGETQEDEFLFQSASMLSVEESIKLVAPTDATVLVVGESGTGKERVAKRIHELSPRKDKPFIIVDCGAVVGSLIESELFGHERGAFTGADKKFSGRLKEANGGTVLLDEIGELPLDVQVKLLRYVQDREIAAVGSSRYETVDTRIIAATNKDLKRLVSEGEFREDLFYRLNVFALETPPLRERKEDILLIARHYLAVYAQRYKKQIQGLTPEGEYALLHHDWPGNIRELTNVINRAVILCKDAYISNIHLGIFITPETTEPPPQPTEQLRLWLKTAVDRCTQDFIDLPPLGEWLEEDLIVTGLEMNNDILNRAAHELGIPESTLRRKVLKLKETYPSGIPSRPPEWVSLETLPKELFSVARARGLSVFDLVNEALVRELERRGLAKKDAAMLMGVSLPTYRRMLSDSS